MAQFINDSVNGITKMFSLAEGETITQGELIWSNVATNVANTIATSMFTRSRVAAGQPPVARILF